MYAFKSHKPVCMLIVVSLISTSCMGKKKKDYCMNNPTGYNICYNDDHQSKKWGIYLYDKLNKRASDKDIFGLQSKDRKRCTKIFLEISAELPNDYHIKNDGKNIILKARSDRTMHWLLHQYISRLAENDERIDDNGLLPAVIEFKPGGFDFAFEYREAFFRPNLDDEYSALVGSNNLEKDWGIWGHNLGKILSDKNSDGIYARQGKWIEHEQYCFSNEHVYQQIKTYIDKNYSGKKNNPTRFMIMPNDNMTACDCEQCKAHGNTKGNATPAVAQLLKKLAADFPEHTFFTGAYLTTTIPAGGEWPENTGIMVSTINLPKGVALTNQKEVKEFLSLLNKWKRCTGNIYIWDYASNFDDYLTPLPILYGMKQQFGFYREHGIKGIFLNASGYDYSTFDYMKTFVSSALMIDNTLSVDKLCTDYFMKFYPLAGEILTDYYLDLEKRLEKKHKPYNMYGGFPEALSKYLDINEFMAFYNAIGSLKEIAEGNEKDMLEKLHTALSFTRLQLAHTQGIKEYGYASLHGKTLELDPEIKTAYDQLSEYVKYEDLSDYKEMRGDLKMYLDNWQKLFELLPAENRLIGETIKAISTTDEDYNTGMLNDGVFGFYGDYHQGWHLSSVADLYIQFPAANIKDVRTISMRFLIDERHNIYSPEKIEIYKDGKMYKEAFPSNNKNKSTPRVDRADIAVNFSDAETVSLKVYRARNKPKSTLACDEVRLN